jgi:hypothetical protein
MLYRLRRKVAHEFEENWSRISHGLPLGQRRINTHTEVLMNDQRPKPNDNPEEQSISADELEQLAKKVAIEINGKRSVSCWATELAEMRDRMADLIKSLKDDKDSDGQGIDPSFEQLMERIETGQDDHGDEMSKEFEVAMAIIDATENLDNWQRVEKAMIDYIQMDVTKLAAPRYFAALLLAQRNRRPEVVRPYLGRCIEMFYEAGFPKECHELVREIFAAVMK